MWLKIDGEETSLILAGVEVFSAFFKDETQKNRGGQFNLVVVGMNEQGSLNYTGGQFL